MVNSGFVQDPKLNDYINKSIAELYDLLITKYGEEYWTNTEPYKINTNGTENTYLLPSDFFKAIGVDLVLSSSQSVTIKPFAFNERNRFTNSYIYSWGLDGVVRARYKLINNKIKFIPNPDNSMSIDIWYIPHAPILVDDADEFDGFNGWEEYVIVDAAIKMKDKEEADTTKLEKRLSKLELRINNSSGNRDAGHGDRVADVYGSDNDYLDGVY